MSDDPQLTCVEIGGSSVETVRFDAGGHAERHDGVLPPNGGRLAIACPGLIEGTRVLGASNLGWYDVDPAIQIGLDGPADLVLNDAEAAALGEAALRGVSDLVLISLGTGIGGAVVVGGRVVGGNLLGHIGGFSDRTCTCGRVGCLETVAAGWALPDPLDARAIDAVAVAIATAFDNEPLATPALIVLGGGIARRYPAIRDRMQICIPEFNIELSAAPPEFKSASAWGLRHAIRRDALRS
jgi:glucokinase